MAALATSVEYSIRDHLKGTTYHKVSYKDTGANQRVSSWKGYWKLHSGVQLACFCPGRKDVSEKEAHLLSSPVGAHCIVEGSDGSKYFAIIPCCTTCNNTNNEHPLVYACQAVTIVDMQRLTYVGDIYLKDSTEYWTEISQIHIEDGKAKSSATRKRKDKTKLTIVGTTNKGRKARCEYRDPDDFLAQVALLLRGERFYFPFPSLLCVSTSPSHSSQPQGKLSGGKKFSKKKDAEFRPQVLSVNKGSFPRNRRDYRRTVADAKTEGASKRQNQRAKAGKAAARGKGHDAEDGGQKKATPKRAGTGSGSRSGSGKKKLASRDTSVADLETRMKGLKVGGGEKSGPAARITMPCGHSYQARSKAHIEKHRLTCQKKECKEARKKKGA